MQKAVSQAEMSNVIELEPGFLPDPGKISRSIVRIHLLGPMRATFVHGRQHPAARPQGAGAARMSLPRRRVSASPRSRIAAMLWDRVLGLPGARELPPGGSGTRRRVRAAGAGTDYLRSRNNIVSTPGCAGSTRSALLAPELLAQNAHRSDLASYCTGELLEELDGFSVAFDQWLLGERTRFTEQRRALLEAELNQANGTNTAANERAEIARRLIMFDPTHEGASRILMRALADMGERGQALREYSRCSDALQTTLEVEPSAETHALYEAIRMFSGRDDRPADAEPDPAPRKKVKSVKPVETPAAQPSARRRAAVPRHAVARRGKSRFVPEPGDRGGARALPLVRRDRADGADAPASAPRSPARSALRPKELDYVVDGALSGDGEHVPDQRAPARSDALRDPGVEQTVSSSTAASCTRSTR